MSITVLKLLQFHEKIYRIFSHNMTKTKSWLFHTYYCIWTPSISRKKYPQFFTQHGKNQILTLSCLLLLYLYSFHFTRKVPAFLHTTWEKPNLDSFMPTTVFELLPFHEKSTRIFSHNMGKTKPWLFQAYLLLMYLYSIHFTKKVPAIFHTTWENTNLDSFMPTTTYYCVYTPSISRKKYPHFFTQHDSISKSTFFAFP